MKSGFTLLELLITLALLGIIIASAIPEYSSYKKKGYDFRAQNDMRNVAIAEEAYYMDSEEYFNCSNEECSVLPGITKISEGTQISVVSDELGFEIESTHPKGTGKTFRWDSENGGEQN